MYKNTDTGESVSRRDLQNRLGMSFPPEKPPAPWTVVDTTPPEPALEDLKARKRSIIAQARRAAEHAGVTVRGVRYSGDSENRRDMKEALDLCTVTGQVSFSAWKDSDGHFHANHPVSDVRSAIMQIAMRRGELIAHEGELMAQIDAAETAEDLDAINWE